MFNKKVVALVFAMMLVFSAVATATVTSNAANATTAANDANVENEVYIEDINESIECYGCQLFVTAIDNYLESNKSISTLENYAMEACQFLGSYKTICEDEIPQVLPLVIEYLEKELTPEEVCQEINVCPSNSTFSEDEFYCMGIEEISACDICTSAMSFVDDYIEQESTQDKLETLFSDECTKFFPFHQTICSEFSTFMIPKITELFESIHICTDIGVCTN